MSDSVKIDLELVTTAFENALKKATKQSEDFGKESKKNFSSVGGSFQVMAGNLLATAALKAFDTIAGQMGRMVDEAKDAEEAANSLASALKVSGNYSDVAMKQFTDYATQLSKVTTLDDDLIVKNQALLTSLTDLTVDGVNQATLAAANLAATMNIDLNQATEMVAKAINGKATPELKGMGIAVSNTASDAQNLSNIMLVLGESNNTAAQKTNTYAGAIAQQDNAYGNLLGSLGSLVTQNSLVIEGIQASTQATIKVTEWIDASKEAINEWVSAATPMTNITSQATRENEKFVDTLLAGTNAMSNGLTFMVAGNQVREETKKKTKEMVEEELRLIEANSQWVQGLAKQNTDAGAQFQGRLDLLTANYTEQEAIAASAEVFNYDAKLQREVDYFSQRTTMLDEQYQKDVERVNQSTALESEKQAAKKQLQAKYHLEYQKSEADFIKRTLEMQKKQKEEEEKNRLATVSATSDLFGALASVAALGGKKNFEIMKAFSIAEATTAGWVAVQKALASAPPPANYIAATAAGIAAAANVARISQTKAPAFQDGGIVGGTSMSGDRIMARVNSGEMVLNKQQQTQLFNMANNGGSGKVENLLADLINTVKATSNTTIAIDGREIINVVRNGLDSGRSF